VGFSLGEEAMPIESKFVETRDGDIIGIQHIVIMTFVGEGTDKRCELILAGGAKKKISAKEGESIRSSLRDEYMILMG
jgi:hypothetical protein